MFPAAGAADADDIGQAVWLQLLDHLAELREPAALARWLASTTHQECSRGRRAAGGSRAAGHVLEAGGIPDAQTPTAEQELLAAERHAALREAFSRLPRCCQQLLGLLLGGQPVSDAQISAKLGISARSIGPRQGRCLDQLRRDPTIAALFGTDTVSGRSPMAGVLRPARDPCG